MGTSSLQWRTAILTHHPLVGYCLRPTIIPDPHQKDAIGWLKACFLSGMPGVLLADDMGLDKTFQVLAFLHWLRLHAATDDRPILVVAPSKLLEEW